MKERLSQQTSALQKHKIMKLLIDFLFTVEFSQNKSNFLRKTYPQIFFQKQCLLDFLKICLSNLK